MKRFLVAGIVAIVFYGAPALAADLPTKIPVYTAPVAVPLHNWTGFYIGGSSGYGWGTESNILTFTDPTVTVPGAIPSGHSNALNGFIGGGGVGYNYQLNNIVVGLEADISYTHFSGSASSSGAFAPIGGPWGGLLTSPFSYSQSSELDWFGTVRGRIGLVATSNLLIYATGGAAFGGAKATTLLAFPLVTFTGMESGTKTGWTAGGGFEYAIDDHWSAKLEYLYYDLGSLLVDDIPHPPIPTFKTSADFPLHGSIARVGINYKLN
jgi:outer membrane immunogenic protein